MKFTGLFLIVALCTFPLKGTSEELIQFESTELGRNLLDTISLELSSTTKDPVANLLTMLNDLLNQCETEKVNKDKEHKEYQEKCVVDLAKFDADIKQANADMAAAQKQLDHFLPLQKQTDEDLAQANSDLKVVVDGMAQAEKDRKEYIEENKKRMYEHTTALEALATARSQVEQLHANYAQGFLQQSSEPQMLLAETSDRLNSLKVIQPGMTSIVKILFQIAMNPQSNQKIITKVLALMDKLKAEFEASRQFEIDSEAKNKATYEKLMKNYRERKAALEALIEKLEKDKAHYDAMVDKFTADLNEATDRRNRLVRERFLRDKQCKLEVTMYEKANRKRVQDISTIKKAIKLVSEKLGSLKSYLKERIANVQ